MNSELPMLDRATENERKRIIKLLRKRAGAETTYEKAEVLNRMACELEGTKFIPDDCRGTKV